MAKAQGLYIISVASQILAMHPQTLRKYERAGFVEPPRMGTLRLYSEEDITRLRLIKYLVEELGLNLAGVNLALDLASKMLALRSQLTADKPAAPAKLIKEIDEALAKLGLEIDDERETKLDKEERGQRAEARRNAFR